jgi:hypothetical protein
VRLSAKSTVIAENPSGARARRTAILSAREIAYDGAARFDAGRKRRAASLRQVCGEPSPWSFRMSLSPFHLAIPVYDLAAARDFYGRVFGLEEGRSSTQWVDFNFFGHQLVIHAHPRTASQERAHTNPVDGHEVPVPHFGVVLGWGEWEALAERLKTFGIEFVIEPYVRFQGQTGEQATMFLLDPCGNALEFKAFKDIGQLFAK